jgi:osmotically-inducible protein OsmY
MRPSVKDPSLEILDRVRKTLRSEPRIGPSFHPSELRWEPDGVLVLGGEVPSVAAKTLGLQRVKAMPEIHALVDRLTVAPAAHMSDKEIRVHLRDALIEELSFKELEIYEQEGATSRLARGVPTGARGFIKGVPEEGVVLLTGRVPGHTSKRLAGVIAWWIPGVRDVINNLAVYPPEDDGPDMIAEAVRVVLEKDPFVDASQIRVVVTGTTVGLLGLVPTQVEKEAAERDAWCIFGVENVLSTIEVHP